MNQFNEIWLPLADRFYRVAYHLLESQDDAEDAVQELYLKLLKSPGKSSEIRDPLAYGITLLRNICIDTIRRREKRQAEALQEYMMIDAHGPDGALIEKDNLNWLITEIEKLPEKQAEVLKMRTIEGLEYENISRRTGLSQVNIRVLISIARKTLKKNLGL